MVAIANRPTPGQAAIAIALLVLLVIYPFWVGALFDRFGVRAVALVGLAMLALSYAARKRTGLQSGAWRDFVASGAILVAASASGDERFLLLLPALINLQLFLFCMDSLKDGRSIIERMARVLQPHLPEFTRGYCRGCTRFWAGFFLTSAVVIAGLAVIAPVAVWQRFTGPVYMSLLLMIVAVEFLIRKIYFRYYTDNWLDRRFSAWFPAEATARGRRSAAYIASFEENEARSSSS